MRQSKKHCQFKSSKSILHILENPIGVQTVLGVHLERLRGRGETE